MSESEHQSPDSHSASTRRIAKNTLMLSARMLLAMLVSLYTSRVVLAALGVEDYGIYNVVGGMVAMFSMVSSSLSASVSRFLTFELGRGDAERLRATFATSQVIHIGLAAIVLLLAETVGVWFLNTQMTIPPSRLTAANWVFQASTVSFMFGIWSVPFNASIVSHEHMGAFARIGILDVVLRLGVVLFVAYAPVQMDRLTVYVLLLVAVAIAMQTIYIRYCRRHFPETRVGLSFSKKLWREISSFAGWNFIGCTAGLLKDQGVNILLNLFIGPVVNAARGLATAVNGAVVSFVGNFTMALNPQITKSYAAGDRPYMYSLIERGSRFSFYIVLILALPLVLEMDFVLSLWLGHYPEHTAAFARLVLALSLCDVLSNTLITAQSATGRIRNYQLMVGGMLLMNFPLSYVCLKLGLAPESTYVVAIAVSLACLMLRLLFLRGMVGLSMRGFLRRVCGNVLCVLLLAAVVPSALHYYMPYGWLRFLVVTVVAVVSAGVVAYAVGCNVAERQFVRERVRMFTRRFRRA